MAEGQVSLATGWACSRRADLDATPGTVGRRAARLKGGSWNCLVVLDGMDEIPSGDDRRDVAARVRSFVDRWAGVGNRFVVTSRVAGYRAAPITGFAHYQIHDMDPETQVPAFLHRYCTALERLERPDATPDTVKVHARARVAVITDAIAATPGIARLAVNPLLLTILVLVQRNNTQIPDQRAKAYDAAVAADRKSVV